MHPMEKAYRECADEGMELLPMVEALTSLLGFTLKAAQEVNEAEARKMREEIISYLRGGN